MLHITNGDSARGLLKASGLIADPERDLVCWRDVLEEGPTPAGLTLSEMTSVRAQFICDRGWGTYDEAFHQFNQRNQSIAKFRNHNEVVFWFEHDLHDQLHIAQSLDWFAQQDLGDIQLSLICIDQFPGIEPFRGLGQLTPEQIATLFPQRRPLTRHELELGQAAWQAYCAADPRSVETWVMTDSSALPLMAPALKRHLAEFPAIFSGLSRTEQQLLDLIAAGVDDPVNLFRQNIVLEHELIYGDWSIWFTLQRLLVSRVPLLKLRGDCSFRWPQQCEPGQFKTQKFQLTTAGQAARTGQLDWFESAAEQRWLGGILLGPGLPAWRWNPDAKKLQQGSG